MHSYPTLTVLAAGQVADLPLSPSGRLPFWASPFPRRLANASGRIEFIIFLIMDWLFASGCSPPRLSTTQLPSATDSQCFCPTGTFTPLLVRTFRRTETGVLARPFCRCRLSQKQRAGTPVL